ncbi:hypothetical protein [Bradyrhizobium sp. SBR1B]|uniref:hypothetical protein n=1 Tax=Bradyrhizobium sp. SBR1B TaxID=2663836 RepID=UPI0016057D6D|nr:hypothetical protein [Bradyrhizobium sp. SBR1B]MBB4382654.1 competence protein ComGC [Bradyrhizobium sp. SBR1B]
MATASDLEISTFKQCGPLIKFAAQTITDNEKKKALAEVITTVQESLDAHSANGWTPAIASKFWISFNSLCSLISPVNTDTLITSTDQIPSRFWLAPAGAMTTAPQRAAFWYMSLLFVLLIVSATLMFLTSNTTTINDDVKNLVKATDPIADDIVKQISILRDKGLTKDDDFVAPGKAELQKDAEYRTAAGKLASALPTLYANADTLYAKTDSVVYLNWKRFPTCERDKEFSKSSFCYEKGDGGIPTRLNVVQDTVDNYRLLSRRAQPITQRAQDVGSMIRATILPILLGLTGSCAYVVRMLSEQIRSSSYSSTSGIRNLVRVTLGALAGVAIGFGGVLSQSSVSAFALSFLAGYAIEPVFATFDSIANKLK